MKNLLLAILTVLIGDVFFSRCANPSNPTGGPKDTIPPTLLNSDPINGSINYSESTIHLEFSEYVNADKLTQNLIITPRTDVKFKHIIKKNQLDIKFDSPFSDSTTYSLNFFEGVTDITERNPAVNLVLAFSTGPFIDSMRVSGSVKDLLTLKPSEKFIVGLYPLSDSLDFLAHGPLYFTTTNDSGSFDISYVKAGLYKILSFKDENRNRLFDPEDEDHGFLSDTLSLFNPIEQLSIPTVLQNIKPLQIVNSRPLGSYHEIKFNKQVDSYTINPDSIFNSLAGENKDILRLYNRNQFNYGDSISIMISASDSLLNSVNDTLKIVFLDSNRKQKDLSTSLAYRSNALTDHPIYMLKFNKPIVVSDSSRIIYKADSTFTFSPDSVNYDWNKNKTQLQLTTYLSKDTLYSRYEKSIPPDTALVDSISIQNPDSLVLVRPNKKRKKKKSQIEFFVLPGAFISVENDSSKTTSITHKRAYKKQLGTLKLKLITDKISFSVQLLDAKNEVKYESKNNKNPVFDVKPATYSVRILIDSNNDGSWSYGNLLRNEEPEEIYLFPDKIPVRENWVVEDYTITF